jgi:hypothetical protein
MNWDEIAALSPRELDALVAKNIEGLPVVWGPDPFRVPDRRLTDHHAWVNGTSDGRSYDWEPVKRYSTDWKATQLVIEAMYRQGWKLHLWSGISPDSSSQHSVVYQVEFSPLEGANELIFPERGVDAPLVVVRAALWTLAQPAKA